MIVLAAAILGAVIGVIMARKQGGNRKDMAQYGAVMALVAIVLAVIASIIAGRFLG